MQPLTRTLRSIGLCGQTNKYQHPYGDIASAWGVFVTSTSDRTIRIGHNLLRGRCVFVTSTSDKTIRVLVFVCLVTQSYETQRPT